MNNNNNTHETVFQSIVAHIFGHKYYANILNRRGTEITEVSSFIFRSREEAEEHREALEGNRSYRVVETVSFRSRRIY